MNYTYPKPLARQYKIWNRFKMWISK